jgi:hypothetical protein
VDCHWFRRQDDPYQTRLGTECEQCHRTTGWTPVNWNHGARTGYALSLPHQALRCDGCHRNGRFANTQSDCFACHRADYERAQNPNHVAAGFSTACQTCHRGTETSFRGSAVNHAAVFPLVGTHAQQACERCHRNSVFAGTPRTCFGCHQDDYQRTANPNHAAAGFSTSCDACHQASAATWTANLNHAQFFPLVGRHQTVNCAGCHTAGTYKGTPRECYPCHQASYNQTRSPDHRAAGFGTNCESCHRGTDNSWREGRFTHRFPITSGPHGGRPCTACHVDAGNYRVFSCTTCHSRGETDSDHRGVNGYRYDSPACYACHPTGRH